jgi:flagellar protein FlaG
MSSETITSAIFLITAVLALAILVNAFFPVMHQTASTFSDSADSVGDAIGSEIKVTYAYIYSAQSQGEAYVFIKNVGSERISKRSLDSAEVFVESPNGAARVPRADTASSNQWQYRAYDNSVINNWLLPGETLRVVIKSDNLHGTVGKEDTITFALPNGISTKITASAGGY